MIKIKNWKAFMLAIVGTIIVVLVAVYGCNVEESECTSCDLSPDAHQMGEENEDGATSLALSTSSEPPLGDFCTDKSFAYSPRCSGEWCFAIDFGDDYYYKTYALWEIKHNNVVVKTITFSKPYGSPANNVQRIWLNGPGGRKYLLIKHVQHDGYHHIYRVKLISSPVIDEVPPPRYPKSSYTIRFLYSCDGSMLYLHTPIGFNRTRRHTVYWTDSLNVVCSYEREIYEMAQRRVVIQPGRIVQINTWDNKIYAECSF